MDNATHTMAALLLGELALLARARLGPAPPTSPTALRSLALGVSMIANNFPDLDFLYAGITGGAVGYLLHHRGHTHTLSLALPQAALSLALLLPFTRRIRPRLTRADWSMLVALAAIGPVAHIAMDYSNNYGVHPFWPVVNGWYYGDFVFIVEPLLFAAMVPALFWAAQSLWAKALLGLLLAIVLGLTFLVGLVPVAMALVVLALATLLFVMLRRARPETRAFGGLVAALVVAGVFFGMTRFARQLLWEHAERAFPDARTHDVIVTPLPASPLCVDFILVQTHGENYVLRSGTLALGPASPSWCGRGMRRSRTAQLEPEAVTIAQAELSGRYQTPLAALASLTEHCQAHAMLRFARAPYLTPPAADGTAIIGDARYDRESGLGFAEMRIAPAPASCPRFIPPWEPPRADLWR